MGYQLTFHRFSERSILIEWPSIIDQFVHEDVISFKNHLLQSNIKSILHIISAYSSILIIYELTIDKINDEIFKLKEHYSNQIDVKKTKLKLWKIPVCYDAEFALDLDEISTAIDVSKSDIIKLHSEAIYTLFFIGFLPGFLYLGGLDERLCFPRRKHPRSRVKKGAVGIGECQTGIYPNESPGGWNIIGNSPISFFDLNKSDKPCFARAGDSIMFLPVSRDAYSEIKAMVDKGSYIIESEIING